MSITYTLGALASTLFFATLMPPMTAANTAADRPAERSTILISSDYEELMASSASLDEAEMLTQLSLFVQQQPDHRPAKITLAQTALKRSKYNLAIQAVESLCGGEAADWLTCYLAGTAYLGKGDHHNARTFLDAALEQDDSEAKIWLHIAVLEQEMGNHTAALHYLNIAGDLAPGNNQVLLNQAYSYENLGQFDSALAAYQKFLAQSSLGVSAARPKVLRQVAQLSQERQRLLARTLDKAP